MAQLIHVQRCLCFVEYPDEEATLLVTTDAVREGCDWKPCEGSSHGPLAHGHLLGTLPAPNGHHMFC